MKIGAFFGFLSLSVMVGIVQAPSASAKQKAPKAGAACSVENKIQSSKSIKFICTKSGKKLVWRAAATKKKKASFAETAPIKEERKKAAPLPERPGPVIAPPTGELLVFAGQAPEVAQEAERSFEVNTRLRPAKSTSNLKLWIYNPENRSKALNSPGVFIQRNFGDWEYFAVDREDGGFDTKLEPGSYFIDVVEPQGMESVYRRGKYRVSVDDNGVATIKGLLPNSAGYFTVSAFLRNNPPSKIPFTATSKCQMEDKSGEDLISNAFPRAAGRLANQGTVRALIIPVEFPDLPGSGSPKANYQEMAKGTADYFYKQSRKSLRFEFTTLPSYVSLKSPVTTYKLESYNEVGAYNLLLASLEAVENTLDISDFDLAFVLPPPGVQASQISIGMVYQAYVQSNEFQNATGRILNGIIGGYDSWSDEPSTRWRWMAQVTSFVFGLPAWSNATETGGFGPWDVVSTPWTSEALEWVSWNKYITGWLADSQINCLDLADITATPKSFIIESLGIDSDKSKSVMIPLSDSRILVVEARASAGFDNLPESRTGLLSYVVDISTKYPSSIGKTQAPNGTNTDLRFAVLKEGDSLSVDGIRINAGKRTGDDFEVQISR